MTDENVEIEVVEALRELGYETTHVADSASGAEDEVILQEALDHGCILVTNDKDFGELVFQQRKTTAGVILLRLPGMEPTHKAELLSNAVKKHADRLSRAFVVLRRGAIRIKSNS